MRVQLCLGAAALLLGSACVGPARTATNATPSSPTTTLALVPREVEVIVYDDRIEPDQLVLDAGVPVRVEVDNRTGAACQFYVGDYLQDLYVPANDDAQMGFTVPNIPGAPGAGHAASTFGCAGDQARVGNLVVMPRPSS